MYANLKLFMYMDLKHFDLDLLPTAQNKAIREMRRKFTKKQAKIYYIGEITFAENHYFVKPLYQNLVADRVDLLLYL